MTQQTNLAKLKVLITRPEPQANRLALQIEAHGGIPILLSCVLITEPDDLASITQAVETLDNFDIAIFISPSAVEQTLPFLKKYWSNLPRQLKIGCVGEGTARALANYQIRVDFYPKARFNSEALLAVPELQQIAGKRIVLFKGEGGKLLLAATLQQRGAIIHNAVAYKRICPIINIEPLLTRWQNNGIDIVVSTSQEALTNLNKILGETGRAVLQKTPLIVISPEMVKLAEVLQINTIILADNATDNAIITALTQYRKQING